MWYVNTIRGKWDVYLLYATMAVKNLVKKKLFLIGMTMGNNTTSFAELENKFEIS